MSTAPSTTAVSPIVSSTVSPIGNPVASPVVSSITISSTSPFAILRGSLRAALQWRLLLLWLIGLSIPTLLMTLPVFQLLSAHLDFSAHVPQLARALDLVVAADLQVAAAQQATLLTNTAYLSVFLTLLISPLLTGMAAAAARAQGVAGFRELIGGGVRNYPRMLRMLLLAIVLLGAFGALAAVLVDAARSGLPTWLAVIGALAAALMLMLVHASIDAGRAVMTLDRRCTMEVRSWWLGCRKLRRHLLAGLGLYLIVSLLGLGLAAGLSWLRLQVPGIGTGGLAAAFALTQATVAALAWMRIARLFALVELFKARS